MKANSQVMEKSVFHYPHNLIGWELLSLGEINTLCYVEGGSQFLPSSGLWWFTSAWMCALNFVTYLNYMPNMYG